MREQRPTLALGKLAEITVGHVGPMASEYVDEGVPFLRSLNVKPHRLDLTELRYISPDFHRQLRKSALRPGDVVIVRTGAPGVTAVVPTTLPESNCSDLVIVRPGPELHPHFLSYYINGAAQGFVASRTVGAVQQHFNVGAAKELAIPVLPYREQRRLAEVLSALDDKIESNRVLIQKSPDLASALLQASSVGGARAALGDLAEVRKGLSYKGAGLADIGMPMVNLANAAACGGFKRSGWKYYTGDYKLRHVAHGGDLLVANTEQTWRNEILGWPMLLPDDVPEALFSHHVSIIDFRPRWKHLRLSVWAHLFTREARNRFEGMAHGTTVAALPAEALTGLDVPVLDTCATVLQDAEALLRRSWAAEQESEALARLRDTLLPALMSGRLRVREAEELVGEAV